MINQTPEQIARDKIDRMLASAGWAVQSKNKVDLSASKGVAVREFQTDIGPADYVLFVDRKPMGVIEAKREEEGVRLTVHEDQAEFYAGDPPSSTISTKSLCPLFMKPDREPADKLLEQIKKEKSESPVKNRKK